MIKRYELWYGRDYSDSLRQGAQWSQDGEYFKINEVLEYLNEKLTYYESKALIYRADAIRKMIKELIHDSK